MLPEPPVPVPSPAAIVRFTPKVLLPVAFGPRNVPAPTVPVPSPVPATAVATIPVPFILKLAPLCRLVWFRINAPLAAVPGVTFTQFVPLYSRILPVASADMLRALPCIFEITVALWVPVTSPDRLPVKPAALPLIFPETAAPLIAIGVLEAAVNRPQASTVNVPTIEALPYEPPVTDVLARPIIGLSAVPVF